MFLCNCDLQVHELHWKFNPKKALYIYFDLFTDIDTLKYYVITVTLQGHLNSKVTMPNERLYVCSYLGIIVIYECNKNCFKDIGNFH